MALAINFQVENKPVSRRYFSKTHFIYKAVIKVCIKKTYEKFIISVKKKVFVLEANTKRQANNKTLLLNAFDWTLQS